MAATGYGDNKMKPQASYRNPIHDPYTDTYVSIKRVMLPLCISGLIGLALMVAWWLG